MSVKVFDLEARLEPLRSHVALFIIKRLASQKSPRDIAYLMTAFGESWPIGDERNRQVIGGKLQDLVSGGFVTEIFADQDDENPGYSLDRKAFAKLVADLSSLGQGSTDTQ